MDEEALRKEMVETQIVARGIRDSRVVTSMKKVPRHEFVPFENRKSAYQDRPCPIGEGQTISQPYMVALMSEALELQADERVLEVGTGSGYQTAILAELGASVKTVECIESLSLKARTTLNKLGYTSIEFTVGDGSAIFQQALDFFDAIIITAASPGIPEHFVPALKEGGRMLAPVGSRDSQVLTRFRKWQGSIEKEELCRCVFVPLIGKYGFH